MIVKFIGVKEAVIQTFIRSNDYINLKCGFFAFYFSVSVSDGPFLQMPDHLPQIISRKGVNV